ncbi:Hpt domain-containing protein [Erythrobacter aquimaris]|uniref:Hpt domain-containing protein n=1 Tax=Qipengyuania aquimaris TaxID=255984 RepID=A0A6I4TM71_9SPHN|nr:Hpt domain-containing protein [Qipengyuania aquimaris]MXO95653.1 Hpt domain-containing protein [Qipengyuania aquimaris]
MAYHSASFDSSLAKAAGEDARIAAELRSAFLGSVEQRLDLLKRARCDANWYQAAERLRGLAASFAADELMMLAESALDAAPGEPTVVRSIEAFIDNFVE